MAIRTLRTLVEGRLPPDSGLLESARLSGLGAEVFGQEAIVAEFARVGRLLGDDAEYLQSEGGLLALDGTRAIVADLYSQRLARLWWVGMPAIAATAPRPRTEHPPRAPRTARPAATRGHGGVGP